MNCGDRAVLIPVTSSLGREIPSTFWDELSILISSRTSTRTILTPGSLLVRLARGWGWSGAAAGGYEITVTLSCQIRPISVEKAKLLKNVL